MFLLKRTAFFVFTKKHGFFDLTKKDGFFVFTKKDGFSEKTRCFLVIHVVILKGEGTQRSYVELRCHYHAKTEFNPKKHRKNTAILVS